MSDTVELFDMPDVPGLRFRRFHGAFDLDDLAAIHAARVTYDRLDPLMANQRPPSAAELGTIYRRRPDFNPDAQMLMAEVDNRLVGYCWLRSWALADGTWVLYHNTQLLPEWRGLSIGRALLNWAENVLTFAAAQRPAGTNALLRADAYSTESHTIARLLAAGYAVEQTTLEMSLRSLDGLPVASLPDGFTLHTPTEQDAREVYFAMEAGFADGWGYVAKTDEDFEALMSAPATDLSLWRYVSDGTDIAGVITCEALAPVGMVQELSVGKAWRRRGLGRALLLAGLDGLRGRGMTQARLYTDAADPYGARRLYESVGFQRVKDVLRYTKPLPN